MSPFLLTTLLFTLLTSSATSTRWQQHQQPLGELAAQRVDLTLGVMSRCPDAVFTETALDSVVERVNDKVRLRFEYIGNLTDSSQHGVGVTEVGGVVCKHGDQECHGNIHQLCVQHALRPSRAGKDYDLSPSAAQRKVWDFVQCQNYDGLAQIGTDALAKQCLGLVKGPKWEGEDGIGACANGDEGRALLRDSVQVSKKRGIIKSATIQLEGKTICVRDGGEWKECPGGHETRDFVRQIEEAWRRKNGQ